MNDTTSDVPALTDEEAEMLRYYTGFEGGGRIIINGTATWRFYRDKEGHLWKWSTIQGTLLRTLTVLGERALVRHAEAKVKKAAETPPRPKRGWVPASGSKVEYTDWIRCKVGGVIRPRPVSSMWSQDEFEKAGWINWCASCEVWTGCETCDQVEPHEHVETESKPYVGFVRVTKSSSMIGPSPMFDRVARCFISSCGQPAESDGRLEVPLCMYHATQRSGHGGTIREWYDYYKQYLPAEPPPAELPNASSAKELAKEMAKEATGYSAGPMAGVIYTESQLARALFTAMMEGEIERRAEVRPYTSTQYRARVPAAVAAIMWNDPAYRKERDQCLVQAKKIWRTKWMLP